LLDERDFEKAIVAGERTSKLLSSRASRRYDRLVRRARDLEVERSIVHSDPSPHNIYYENGVIELIDVACKDAPLVRDQVAVDIGIELMVARLPYGRRSQVEQLTYSYRSGYGRRSTEPDAYDLQRLVKLVRLLAYYADGPTKPNAKLTKLTDVPILRDRILQNLQGTEVKTGRTSSRKMTMTT
jgi:tRNA A-37 threonylcarbamoyl transferase component Bud32